MEYTSIELKSEKNSDRLKEITDRLEQGVTELFESERYKEYLRVMARFHNYSFNNTLLIAMQCPGATRLAGFHTWKKFGRHVKKGEKGIKVIAPAPYKTTITVGKADPHTMQPILGADGKPVKEEKEVVVPRYKVVSTYDVSQTEGKPLPTIATPLMEHLKWFAAFHNEGHHPHVHLLAYSTVENEGYLTKKGVHNLRPEFAKDIFAQDLHCIYEQQTEYRDELRAKSKEKVAKLVEQINSGLIVDPQLKQMLVELSRRLKHHKGKKVYGYLSAGTKKLVDNIVDLLGRDSRIAALYDLWYRQRDEIFKTYSGDPSERLPLSQNPEFKPIRNAVVKAALGVEHPEESMEEQQEPDDPGYFSREYGGKKSWWTDEYKLARKYLYGSENSPPNPVRAMEQLQREAEKGNGFALYDLGLMARNGFGCEKNDVLAQERFRKALAAFVAEESQSKRPDYWQYRIGKMYVSGYGTEQDFRKAAEWYEKAAAEGNPFAAYALGCLYRRGQGVERDEVRAIAYFQAAAARGNEYAQRLLDSLHSTADGQGWSATNAALSLMRQAAGIFQDRFRELDNEHMRHTDRKLMSKIAEKKLAQGQKLGG